MSQKNLDKRVEKAKELEFTQVELTSWATKGSKGDVYVVDLSHGPAKDTESGKTFTAFFTVCNKHSVNLESPTEVQIETCPGNCHHTVCYHALGTVIDAYKDTDKILEFYETYQQANDMAVYENGDKLVKIFNDSMMGIVWLLVREPILHWPIAQYVPVKRIIYEDDAIQNIQKKEKFAEELKEAVNLMRGLEDDEGID
jgi:hypothetical protein